MTHTTPTQTATRPPARRRLRRLTTAVGLAAASVASLVATTASPAAAATKFDGVWTIDNGGTGQIVMNGDYTFTSTCQALPSFPDARCPSASGTFSFGWTTPYVTFTGNDGKVVTFRYSGDVIHPSSLSDGGYGGIIADRGTTFTCSVFYDSTYAFARSPLVYTNAKGTKGFALGSGQSVGSINAGNYVFLAETKPGYFIKSSKCPA